MTTILSTPFINSAQNSFSSSVWQGAGDIRWQTPLHPGVLVQGIIESSRAIVVDLGSTFQLLSTSDGRLLDTRDKVTTSPVSVVADTLAFIDPEGFMTTLKNNEDDITLTPAPGIIGERDTIGLLIPMTSDFLTVSYPPKHPKQGTATILARTTYGRALPDSYADLAHAYELNPLYDHELKMVYIFHKFIYSYTNDLRKPHKLTNPMASIVSWSLNLENNLILTGFDPKGRYCLTEYSNDGQVHWQWQPEIELKFSKKQPPVAGKNGKVYLFTVKTVMLIAAGKEIWETPLPSPPDFATAMADGNILVGAGDHLFRLDTFGKIIKKIRLDSRLTAPPFILSNNTVVATTNLSIYCIT